MLFLSVHGELMSLVGLSEPKIRRSETIEKRGRHLALMKSFKNGSSQKVKGVHKTKTVKKSHCPTAIHPTSNFGKKILFSATISCKLKHALTKLMLRFWSLLQLAPA